MSGSAIWQRELPLAPDGAFYAQDWRGDWWVQNPGALTMYRLHADGRRLLYDAKIDPV